MGIESSNCSIRRPVHHVAARLHKHVPCKTYSKEGCSPHIKAAGGHSQLAQLLPLGLGAARRRRDVQRRLQLPQLHLRSADASLRACSPPTGWRCGGASITRSCGVENTLAQHPEAPRPGHASAQAVEQNKSPRPPVPRSAGCTVYICHRRPGPEQSCLKAKRTKRRTQADSGGRSRLQQDATATNPVSKPVKSPRGAPRAQSGSRGR